MWSGPRNLSTALMYAFAQRADCAVVDEPFYAAYLSLTGLDHPMRDDIIAAGPTSVQDVMAQCLAPPPPGSEHVYQKHMTQHMIDGIDRAWMADVTNAFLIRHPARVIASYAAKRERPTLEDIGFPQQVALYEHAVSLGQTPVVIDSVDVRANPRAAMTALSHALGLDFDAAMLRWPAGGRSEDGIWASHWYGAVHRSTGFAEPEGDLPVLTGEAAALCDRAMPHYQALSKRKLEIPSMSLR